MRVFRPGRFELVAAAFLAATAAAAVRASHGWMGADFGIYSRAGATMLSGAWRHTYGPSMVQATPLELALDSVLQRAAGWSAASLQIVSDTLVAGLLIAGTRIFAGRRALPLLLVAAGAVALGIVTDVGQTGHFAEPIAGLLWLLAAREARNGRVERAGLLIGVSAGFELWGILGIAVLALAPDLRRALRGVALAVAVPALLLAPFVLGGDFHMFAFRWHVTGGLIHLMLPHLNAFPWPFRFLQGAVTVGAAGGLARAVRGSPSSVFLVPALAAAVRLGLDPMSTFYYWDVPLVIELIGMATAIAQLGALRGWVAARVERLHPAVGGVELT
jgi:hypothetical protein